MAELECGLSDTLHWFPPVGMTRMLWVRRFARPIYWALMAGLVVAVMLGGARVYRESVLSAPINEGISSEVRLDNALELARRVAARFRYIEDHGPVGDVSAWLLRSDADYLLTGGDCGRAAAALGAVFVSRGRPFRVLQANLGPNGAGHIMFETPDDAGRWVLLDPLEGRGFPSPRDGRLLGIDEIRALPLHERGWLAEEYRSGDLSLFAPYRRTNWARLGPLAGVLRAVEGDAWMRETSLRVVMLRADRGLTEGAVLALLLLAIAGVLTRRPSAGDLLPRR
jgi:hypothetical protein